MRETETMLDDRRIEAGWESYRKVVIPPGASTVQLTESRKAFYAGAIHTFRTILNLSEGPDTEEAVSDSADKVGVIATELLVYMRDEIGVKLDTF